MAIYTSKLNLYKANPQEDGESTFNIDTMLNENWDKIDQNAGETSGKLGDLSQLQTTDKSSLVSANNEINNDLAAHLNDNVKHPTKTSQLTNDSEFITASSVPVQSVNGKTGTVSLTAANVGAAPAAHVNDTTIHITSAERSAWNSKPSSQRAVSDSVSSTSSSVVASSKAVKTAYDKGVSAYNLANTKEPAFSKNNAFNKNFGTASGTVCQGNDSRLSNSRKCNNTFDNVSTARSNLGLTGTSNTTHYHDSRYVQTRVCNGKFQYYDGGWKDVGGQGFDDVDLFYIEFQSKNYITLCDVSGSGILNEISATPKDYNIYFKIVLDGVTFLEDLIISGTKRSFCQSPPPTTLPALAEAIKV